MKLSKQAMKVLGELKENSPLHVEELVSSGFDQSMVNRAILELQEKELAEMEKDEELVQEITEA